MLKYTALVLGPMSYYRPISHIAHRVNEDVTYRNISEYIDDIDLVMFTGGEDITPPLYGYKNMGDSNCNPARDFMEKYIFDLCIKHDIRMTGICRGFQFLNVMAGGAMYQDVDGHALVGVHLTRLPNEMLMYPTTSTHHQLVMIPDGAIPIAWADPNLIKSCIGPDGGIIDKPDMEIESAIFPDINAVGVQYHPEMMNKNSRGRLHYEKMIEDFLSTTIEEFVYKYGQGSMQSGSDRKNGRYIKRREGAAG